jgi:membrane protein
MELIDKGRRLFRWLSGFRVGLYAAHASFFMILAMFPTLLLLLGLLRYTGMEVESLTGLLTGFIPQALVPNARRLIENAYRNSSGALLSVSALTALWSAKLRL